MQPRHLLYIRLGRQLNTSTLFQDSEQPDDCYISSAQPSKVIDDHATGVHTQDLSAMVKFAINTKYNTDVKCIKLYKYSCSMFTNLSNHRWMSSWNWESSRTRRVKLNSTLMLSFKGFREDGCDFGPSRKAKWYIWVSETLFHVANPEIDTLYKLVH